MTVSALPWLAAGPGPAHADDVTEDLSKGASFTFKIAPSLTSYVFKLKPNSEGTISDIDVLVKRRRVRTCLDVQ